MGSYCRIRSVKLKRKSTQDPFGFTLRGGQEHGTGIFVSAVAPKSIADKQGLKVGDQILRVNGFPLSASTHKECLAVIAVGNRISLKIRSVGMIPVKDPGQPLTWYLVDTCHPDHVVVPSPNKPDRQDVHSKKSDASTLPCIDLQDPVPEMIRINTQGQAGLGCCICRGPPEKPGIFVRSTKSTGLARQAGLRPGDQILECNGYSFRHVEFPEAIYHLKARTDLNLRVIKGGACDLFPGESSGYNSSASSVNGEGTSHVSVGSDQSSNSELEDALSRVQILGSGSEPNKTCVVALDRNMEWEEVEDVWRSAKKESLIIQIKGEPPLLPPLADHIRHKELQLSLERRNLEEEQRKLREEAQKLELDKMKFEEEKRQLQQRSEVDLMIPAPSFNNPSPPVPPKHPDLAGALSNEILKRTSRREVTQAEVSAKASDIGPTIAPHRVVVDDTKRRQHDQLIEEFKRAHRKMFTPALEGLKNEVTEERASFRVKRIQKEFEHTKKMVQNHVAGIVKQRQLRIERQHREVQESEREVGDDDKPKGVATPTLQVVIDKKPLIKPPQPQTVHFSPSVRTGLLPDDRVRQPAQNGPARVQHHVEFSTRPESPSPDYSNTPSPEVGRRFIQRKQPPNPSRSGVPGILKT